MDALAVLCVVAFVLVAMLVMLTSAQGKATVLALVGFSCGFDQLQLLNVHLATIFAALLVLFPTDDRVGERTQRRLQVLSVAVLLLASTVLYGDLTNSRLIGLQLVFLTATGVLVCLKSAPGETDHVLSGLWAGTFLACLVAALQYFQVIPTVYFADSAGIDRVTGPYREPDFLAYFASVGLVLAFRVVRRRWLQLASASVFVLVVVVSFARATYVGLAVSTLVVVVSLSLARHEDRPRRKPPVWLVGVVGVATAAAIATNAGLRETLHQRSLDALAVNSGDVGIRARRGQLETLLDLAETAPWNGWGLSAAGRVQDLGQLVLGTSTNNVATNWVLDWWIGGALLSLPLILFVLWLSWAARLTVAGHLFLLTTVTSLFTNAMILPITFVLIGVCLRELDTRLGRPSLRRPVRARAPKVRAA